MTILLVIQIQSCQNVRNPSERNKLVFKDKVKAISDSILEMNKIISETGKRWNNYGIGHDFKDLNNGRIFFYINIYDSLSNPQKVGLITDSLLYKSKFLNFIDLSKRKRFINLALYLYHNKLTGCNIKDSVVVYDYKNDIYMADFQQDLYRFVVLSESPSNIDSQKQYKILDKDENLYLLAPSNARIWSN